jgi:hypothetical protein
MPAFSLFAILGVDGLRLRLRNRCGLGLNRNLPFSGWTLCRLKVDTDHACLFLKAFSLQSIHLNSYLLSQNGAACFAKCTILGPLGDERSSGRIEAAGASARRPGSAWILHDFGLIPGRSGGVTRRGARGAGVEIADLFRPPPIRTLRRGFLCLQNAKILRSVQTLSSGLPCVGDGRLPLDPVLPFQAVCPKCCRCLSPLSTTP